MTPLIVRRGVIAWVLIRLALAVGTALSPDSVPPIRIDQPVPFSLKVGVVAICVVYALADLTRLRERLLIGNLGISVPMFAALSSLGAIAGETMLGILLAAL